LYNAHMFLQFPKIQKNMQCLEWEKAAAQMPTQSMYFERDVS